MILPSKVGNSLFHAASLFLTLSITSRQNSFSVGLFPLGGPSVSLAAFALHSLVNKAFEQTCSSNPIPSRPLLLRLTFRSEPSRRIEVPALGYDSIRISSEEKDSSISILKMRHLNPVWLNFSLWNFPYPKPEKHCRRSTKAVKYFACIDYLFNIPKL